MVWPSRAGEPERWEQRLLPPPPGEHKKTGTAPITCDSGFLCRPCKPGSVLRTDGPEPLSFIYGGSHLPSPATYPPASGEQPLNAGVHGLATRGTYGRPASLPPRWALTPPFHPYLPEVRTSDGRSFSVTLPHPHGHQVDWLARCSVLPGLSSPDRSRQRQSGPAAQR